MSDGDRALLVDASVVITLSRIGCFGLLDALDGQPSIPETVVDEVTSEPAQSTLDDAVDDWVTVVPVLDGDETVDLDSTHETARAQLNADDEEPTGDVALLTAALDRQRETENTPVVVTDDRPLRQTCKALSIPVSGSIGVLIRAVECDALEPDEAKDGLAAMDEVGARLSASLFRRAERLIDEADSD